MVMSDGWPPYVIARLREEWAARTPRATIAALLGKSPAAIAGKVYRLGLASRSPPPLSQTRRARSMRASHRGEVDEPPAPVPVAPVADTYAAAATRPVAPPEAIPAFIMPAPGVARRGPSQPPWGRCQFARGEPPDYRWCGEPAAQGTPYCPACRARCYASHWRPEAAA
jgi:GcrA cell cycle regulator